MKKRKQTAKIDPRLVYFDVLKLDRARLDAGVTQKDCTKEPGGREDAISWPRVQAAFRGQGVFPSIAKRIADRVECKVTDLLSPFDPRATPCEMAENSLTESEWQVAAYDGPGVVTSNGLHFFVCRLTHRHVAGRQGRGKFYHLSYLPTAEQAKRRQQLLRHPAVTERIGAHPHMAQNIVASPVADGQAWWVIDRWVGREKLADRLVDGPWPEAELPRLMAEILAGLESLHRAGIVFRELAPSRVLIAADDGRAVLSEFELAKLLDNSPTVSEDWPDDPYRAPEVESGRAGPSADLYSWARILVHALAGTLPDKGQEFDVLTAAGLPKGLWRVAVDCLSPGPSNRPRNVQAVLRTVARWQSTATKKRT